MGTEYLITAKLVMDLEAKDLTEAKEIAQKKLEEDYEEEGVEVIKVEYNELGRRGKRVG
jgi:hypothetical protein